MLQTLRRRLQGEREGGFTLIELMVEPSLTYKAKGTASTGQNDVSADGTTNAGPVGRDQLVAPTRG